MIVGAWRETGDEGSKNSTSMWHPEGLFIFSIWDWEQSVFQFQRHDAKMRSVLDEPRLTLLVAMPLWIEKGEGLTWASREAKWQLVKPHGWMWRPIALRNIFLFRVVGMKCISMSLVQFSDTSSISSQAGTLPFLVHWNVKQHTDRAEAYARTSGAWNLAEVIAFIYISQLETRCGIAMICQNFNKKTNTKRVHTVVYQQAVSTYSRKYRINTRNKLCQAITINQEKACRATFADISASPTCAS